ncbi:TRAP dicarboxylate transporter, DctQ subunit [Pseudovibrio sp. FO-BEG1]|uniref:TRAP transporter small permease n=1 Tax=unclassified Pseudovibrio TaxID=2627060 RepID=UPI000186BC5A|nr:MULTISPECIES: TRAP transporter small permease [unclassified Pseudovibrio]AEV37339.1 TRAP dicarboxylate transporter, DctQ subunit [Pseudovibrio sp. FO-BEG1]EEA96323.1 TRAP transporter, DctQ-like membrane protein [Pseudovibrio sp. JE062]
MSGNLVDIAARARRKLRSGASVLCGLLLLALVAVTVIDVIGRYLFASPLPGAPEYTELLLMAVIFTGLPAVCLDDGHITVDLFTSKFRGGLASLQLFFSRIFVAIVLAVVAWELWKHGNQLASYQEVTVYLRVPLAPFSKAAGVISAFCAFITFVLAVLRIPRGVGGGS